jgi:rare lipoprotein A
MQSARARAALVAALLVTACATKRPEPVHTPPAVKIGKPYQVFGVTYYPADDRHYDQRGLASWYGPGFHALDTANGERYNQDDLTAAHKTLPMPSYVEVENLDNGRKLTVRINDRGPFVAGRIIDLSRKSAQLLGVDKPGTAHVRVRRVFPNGQPPVIAASPSPIPVVTSANLPKSTQIFVQVAALADPGRIAWLKGYLTTFGPVVTEIAPSGLTRVRLGPYPDADTANGVLAKVRSAGYSDARLSLPISKP